MRSRTLLIAYSVFLPLCSVVSAAAEGAGAAPQGGAFAGQDLYLRGPELARYRPHATEHILVFQQGLSLSVGAHQFAADRAVVWAETATSNLPDQSGTGYEARVYLEGHVSTGGYCIMMRT